MVLQLAILLVGMSQRASGKDAHKMIHSEYLSWAFRDVPKHKIFTNNGGYILSWFKTKYLFERYCLDFEQIENYEKAKADNFKGWHCHHKLEEFCTRKELIENNLYYNRTPSELIFLTSSEHTQLHLKLNYERGATAKGKHNNSSFLKPSYKERLSERVSSYVWCNNGMVNKRVLPNNIPNGFVLGRIKNKKECPLRGKTWKVNSDGRRVWL